MDCQCPIHIEGKFGDQFIRRSTGTRFIDQAEEMLEAAERNRCWKGGTPEVERVAIASGIQVAKDSFKGAAIGRRGKCSEYLVVADLLRRGYEVFTPINPICPYDLLAMDGERFIRLEVKTVAPTKNCIRIDMAPKSGNIDVAAMVHQDGRVEYYSITEEDQLAKTLVIKSGGEKKRRLYALARARMEESGKLLPMAG